MKKRLTVLSQQGAEIAKKQAENAAAAVGESAKKQIEYRARQVTSVVVGKEGMESVEALLSPTSAAAAKVAARKKKEEEEGGASPLKSPQKEAAISQDDIVQPLEAGAKLKVSIVSASDLAKADTFGKSDPMCVVYFMDEEVGSTHAVDNTMDPVWHGDERATFEIPLPKKHSKPVLRIEVYDSDAPSLPKIPGGGGKHGRASLAILKSGAGAAMGAGASLLAPKHSAGADGMGGFNPNASPTKAGEAQARAAAKAKEAKAKASAAARQMMLGDFLGMVTISGAAFLHPQQNDVTPQNTKSFEAFDSVLGDTYELTPNPERNAKFNKLVQGSIKIGISRELVDKQIVEKNEEAHRKHMARQAENEALLHLEPPSALVMHQRANIEGGLWVPKK